MFLHTYTHTYIHTWRNVTLFCTAEAFTMDSNLSRAVTEAFVRFHEVSKSYVCMYVCMLNAIYDLYVCMYVCMCRMACCIEIPV